MWADPPPPGEGESQHNFRIRISNSQENTIPRPRGMNRPSCCKIFVPLRAEGAGDPQERAQATLREGAGKAGCALHPRSHVQKCAKQIRTRAYRFSGEHPAFPAQWFYGLLRALPGDRAFLPPSPREPCPHDLTPASGRQNHTTSPSASALFVKSASASIASCADVRDDRDTPLLWARDSGDRPMIWPRCEAIYFC